MRLLILILLVVGWTAVSENLGFGLDIAVIGAPATHFNSPWMVLVDLVLFLTNLEGWPGS